MTSQSGLQTIAIQILPYISQSKGNQPDNETWSINRIQQEEYFSSIIMRIMSQRDKFQTFQA